MKILTIKQSLSLAATVLSMSATAALASDLSSTIYTVVLKDGQECYLDHGNPIPLPGNGVESNRVTIFTGAEQHQWYIDRDGRKVSLTPSDGMVDLDVQQDHSLTTASNPVTYLTSHGEPLVVQQEQPVIIEETTPNVVSYYGTPSVAIGIGNYWGYPHYGWYHPYYSGWQRPYYAMHAPMYGGYGMHLAHHH